MIDRTFAQAQESVDAAFLGVALILVLLLFVAGCGPQSGGEAPSVDSTSSAILEDALAALRLGDYHKALVLANQADSLRPGLTETAYVKGQIFYDLRVFDLAGQFWTQARDAEPEYWLWHHNLGDVRFHQARFREAEEHYRRAAELDPNPVSLHGLANVYWELGMADSTEQALQRAVQVDSTYAPLYVTLSTLAEEQGDVDRASVLAHRAVELDSLKTDHQVAAGVLDFKTGKTDEAMVHLGRVLAVEPANATALYNYGQALQQSGDREEAEQFLQAAETAREQERSLQLLRNAIATNPTNPQNQLSLAQLLHASGRLDEAIRAYKAADVLGPGSPRLRHTIATLHLQRGDLAEAARRYREIISTDSTLPEAWLNLGLTYARMDSMERANEVWREAGRLFPENDSVREVVAKIESAGR